MWSIVGISCLTKPTRQLTSCWTKGNLYFVSRKFSSKRSPCIQSIRDWFSCKNSIVCKRFKPKRKTCSVNSSIWRSHRRHPFVRLSSRKQKPRPYRHSPCWSLWQWIHVLERIISHSFRRGGSCRKISSYSHNHRSTGNRINNNSLASWCQFHYLLWNYRTLQIVQSDSSNWSLIMFLYLSTNLFDFLHFEKFHSKSRNKSKDKLRKLFNNCIWTLFSLFESDYKLSLILLYFLVSAESL